MHQRTLGPEGPSVSALGLGCMGMSEFYGPTDEAEAIRTIHRALELGVTLLDTADMYGPGTNERLVGRAVREWSGERARVATKFGYVPAADRTGEHTAELQLLQYLLSRLPTDQKTPTSFVFGVM